MLYKFLLLLLACIVSIGKGAEDVSPPKQRYLLPNSCLTALQQQIHNELYASFVYLSMAAHFGNNKIARDGFADFFKKSSDEERDHAQKIIDYINLRGGKVQAFQLQNPTKDTWEDAHTALTEALTLEQKFYDKFYELHMNAEHICKDIHLMDFLEEFLKEQAESINQLQKMVSQLGPMKDAMGEYMIDESLRKKSK